MKKIKNSDLTREITGENEVTYRLRTPSKSIFPTKLKAKANNEVVTLILFDEDSINRLQESLRKIVEIQRNESAENKNPLKKISEFILQ